MSTALVLEDDPARGVRVLRLNRPDKRNALATPVLGALAEALRGALADDAIGAVIVTGGEKVFAAGADLADLSTRSVADTLADARPSLWAVIRQFPKPLLAAVEGWCLGAGNELAMCCDLIVAARGARFGQPESNLGLIPGAGGTAVLARLVGRQVAFRMAALGETLTAEEALACGLVCELAEDGEALARAVEFASKLATRAPLAIRQVKASIRAADEMALSANLAFERQAFSSLFGTDDLREGISAFFDKRTPSWTGR